MLIFAVLMYLLYVKPFDAQTSTFLKFRGGWWIQVHVASYNRQYLLVLEK